MTVLDKLEAVRKHNESLPRPLAALSRLQGDE